MTSSAPAATQEVFTETTKVQQPNLWRRTTHRWPVKIAILAIIIVWLIPTAGILISSFRPPALVDTTGWWTVFTNIGDNMWTLENYREVLRSEGFGSAFLNSLAVTIPATVIPITIAAFAAYAFAWMEFPGRQVVFVIVVALLVIPLQMALIPLLRLYIGSLPSSIIESARIDGATHFDIFTRLIVPLSVPVLASFAIFQFLWVWNDLLVALVFLGGKQDVQVVTLALAELNGSRGESWHLLTAGAFITMALPLVVFLSLQRYFVRGLTAGSVKG
jgi:alpha-glucoside transport system permease protein